jgi:hypothetical protein
MTQHYTVLPLKDAFLMRPGAGCEEGGEGKK